MEFVEKKMEEKKMEEKKIEESKIEENKMEEKEKEDSKEVQGFKQFVLKKQLLFDTCSQRTPSCSLIVIDNFYRNATNTRNFILGQDFSVKGNFPGKRTISYATNSIKDQFEKYVSPFAGKITNFPCPKADNSDADKIYNGSFQYTTSRDRSWIHTDSWNNWAGVLFLTPDAPMSSGTAFYRFCDGSMTTEDGKIMENSEETNKFSQDLTKWELADTVGNVFNRLVLFNSKRFHMSMDYFGDTKETGRLFQVFFFTTER